METTTPISTPNAPVPLATPSSGNGKKFIAIGAIIVVLGGVFFFAKGGMSLKGSAIEVCLTKPTQRDIDSATLLPKNENGKYLLNVNLEGKPLAQGTIIWKPNGLPEGVTLVDGRLDNEKEVLLGTTTCPFIFGVTVTDKTRMAEPAAKSYYINPPQATGASDARRTAAKAGISETTPATTPELITPLVFTTTGLTYLADALYEVPVISSIKLAAGSDVCDAEKRSIVANVTGSGFLGTTVEVAPAGDMKMYEFSNSVGTPPTIDNSVTINEDGKSMTITMSCKNIIDVKYKYLGDLARNKNMNVGNDGAYGAVAPDVFPENVVGFNNKVGKMLEKGYEEIAPSLSVKAKKNTANHDFQDDTNGAGLNPNFAAIIKIGIDETAAAKSVTKATVPAVTTVAPMTAEYAKLGSTALQGGVTSGMERKSTTPATTASSTSSSESQVESNKCGPVLATTPKGASIPMGSVVLGKFYGDMDMWYQGKVTNYSEGSYTVTYDDNACSNNFAKERIVVLGSPAAVVSVGQDVVAKTRDGKYRGGIVTATGRATAKITYSDDSEETVSLSSGEVWIVTK